jgi:hypothetical protein
MAGIEWNRMKEPEKNGREMKYFLFLFWIKV